MAEIRDTTPGKTSTDKIRSMVRWILEVSLQEPVKLYRLCDELYQQLSALVRLDPDSDSQRSNKALHSGTAIGTTWAAMCIKDLVRPKKFVDGVYQAVKQKLDTSPGLPLHIVYAGTGPFATLALPLFFSFSDKEIQFSMIEVNEESFTAMKETVRLLDASGYIRRYIQDDAAFLKMPGEKTDILICETIQRALKKEPQVSILLNLVPQLDDEFTLIPEEIRLDAAISNPQMRMRMKQGLAVEDHFKKLKNILILNKNGIRDAYKNGFREVELNVSASLLEQYPELQIHSHIRVFGDIEIRHDESAITLPEPIKRSGKKGNLSGIFKYRLNEEPGMVFTER